MRNIVTVNNVAILEYSALMELLGPIYTKEIPEISGNNPLDVAELDKLMVFFANQYAYMAELWGAILYHVRVLKRTGAEKDLVEDAMAKRDWLEKVMSATKLKYYGCNKLVHYHRDDA